jgi:hypothetical protein
MSNPDITTLKEKLKNIPIPRPRTIDWCDEYPTSYGDSTMRHSELMGTVPFYLKTTYYFPYFF